VEVTFCSSAATDWFRIYIAVLHFQKNCFTQFTGFSVLVFFAVNAFNSSGLGYWVVGFWIIIALYSIDPDIGFFGLWCHHRFLRHRQDIGFIGFGSSSLLTA
jgi:hypothetical protein